MSDGAQGPGWWLASDGRWYPPELAPAAPGGETPAGTTGWTPFVGEPASVNPALATAVRVTFWVVAGASVVRVLLTVAGWVTYAGFRSERNRSAYDTWQAVSAIGGAWGVLSVVVDLGLLVLVIVWSWQAHRTVTELGAPQRWRIGWTIGAWFTCCAAIVIPKLVLNGIERGALAARRDGRVTRMWDRDGTKPIGWVWWLALVGSWVRFDVSGSRTGNAMRDALTNGGFITTEYTFAVGTGVLAVVAAVAGGAYFARMSRRLTPAGLAAHRDD